LVRPREGSGGHQECRRHECGEDAEASRAHRVNRQLKFLFTKSF